MKKSFNKTSALVAGGLLVIAGVFALGSKGAFDQFSQHLSPSLAAVSEQPTANSQQLTAAPLPPCAGTAVGGVVWRDFNNNGVKDAGETRNVAGVTVNVFDCNGASVGTTTTAADGTWVISSGVSVGQQVRVEFCNIPSPYTPSKFGTNNGTTIQFITVPNCTVDLGVNNPDDFCQTNPKVKIPCFVNGLRSSAGASPAIVSFEYNGNTTSSDLPFSQIGTAWGLAYNRTTKFMYASAFLKRHTDLGPLGLGGVYKLDYSGGGAPVMSNFYTVPAVGTVTRPADLMGLTDPNVDADAFTKIGKVGLGDIDISADGTVLWTVNLATRKLVKITNVLSGSVASSEITIGSAPTCSNGVFRPFALKVYGGKVYVGGVCTGETGGGAADLNFSVHAFDPVANTWTMELSNSLSPPAYLHGNIVSSTGECGEFESWTDIYDEKNVVVNGEGPLDLVGTFEKVAPNFRCRGQAWVCDLEFSDEGYMLIAIMDRTGHQLGYQNHRPTGGIVGDMISSNNGGDILVAAKVGSTWTLETNGSIPGGATSAGGVGNAQGPNNGEFFYQNTGAGHLDNDAGGLVVVPGKNEVLSAVLDPANTFGGGVSWYNMSTGGKNKDLVVYAPPIGTTGLGKANGLGDMEAFCDPQPIEIGNYVWHDQNSNGKQDPCELPLSSITVTIYKWNGTKVGTTQTNANGQYYFNNTNVDTLGGTSFTGLRPGTPYYVVIGEGGQFVPGTGKLNNLYTIVTPNLGMGCATDENDSDGIPLPAGQPGAMGALVGYPWFCVPPQPPGACHGKDFGFSSCVPIDLTVMCDGTTVVPAGGTVNLCPGATKQLTVTSTPAGTILWSNNATTATITVSAVGAYSVTVTEPVSGCTKSQTLTVATPTDPCVCSPLTLSMVCNGTTPVPAGGTVGLCPGASKTLTIQSVPVSGMIAWSNGATTPTITVTATGTYSVTVTNAGGCSKTFSTVVAPTTVGCGPTCSNPTPVKTWNNLTPGDRTTLKAGGMVTNFNTGHCYDADNNPATANPPMLVKITSSAAPNAPTPGTINATQPGRAGDDDFRLGRMMSGTSGVMYCFDFTIPTSLSLDSKTHNCLTASEKVIISASYVNNPVALTATMNGVPGPATATVGGTGNATATMMANGKQGCGAYWAVHSQQQLVDHLCIQYFRTVATEEPGEETFTLNICGTDCVTTVPYTCGQSNKITRFGSFTNAERMELLGMDADPDGDGNRVSGFDSGLCNDNGDPVRIHVSGSAAFGPGANTANINARKPRQWDNGDFFMARATSGAGTGVQYCFDLDEPSQMEVNSREHAYFDSSEHVVVRAWIGPDPVNITGTLNGATTAPATVTGSGTPQVVFDANGRKGRGVWWQAVSASCVTRVCVSYYRTNASESPGVEPFQIKACGPSCNPAPPVTCVDPEPITRWNRLPVAACTALEDNDMTTNVEDFHTGFCDESGDPILMDIDVMGSPKSAVPTTINNKQCGRWGQTSYNNTREMTTNSGTKTCFTFTEAMPACVSSKEHQHFTDGERVCVTAFLGNDPVNVSGTLNGPVSTATLTGSGTVEVCFNANNEQGDQIWWEACTGDLPVTTICVEYYRTPGTDAFGNEPFDVNICNSNRCLFEEKYSCMDPDNPNMTSPSCQEDNLVLTKENWCVRPAASGVAGNVDLTFRLKLTNNGSVSVTKLQLEDDLRDHIPANVLVAFKSAAIGAGNTAATNPGFNAAYNGTTDVRLLNGTSGQLNGGQTLVVDMVVELNPGNLPTYGDYANFCYATGEFPTGKKTTASSDSPPNHPGDTPGGPTDATWLFVPSINVAKRAINLAEDCTMAAGDVQFTLEFVIQNTGNTNLDRINLMEDLSTQMGLQFKNIVGVPNISASTALQNPIVNAAYNGKTITQVFNGTSGLLAPGQSITLQMRVQADPNAAGCSPVAITNQATVTGRGIFPNGNPLPGCDNGEMVAQDKSDNGSVPESNNSAGGSDDPTPLPLPSISVAKHIAGVDCATSNIAGHFDLIFEIIVENTGNVPLTGITLTDNMTAASQYGSAFYGMVTAPAFVPTGAYGTIHNAATNPTLNAAYAGTGSILTGGGTLNPCQRAVIRFRVEVNPDAPGAPAIPKNIATGCANGTGFAGTPTNICDDSDSGPTPESNNPDRPGDTGGHCDPTPLGDCHEDVGNLACNDLVQVSMNEDCMAVITPGNILEGEDEECADSEFLPLGGYYDVKVMLPNGIVIPDAVPSTPNDYEIGAAYLGMTLTVKVTDVVLKNSCWGQIHLEDKLAPEIFCVNHTINCTQDVDAVPPPTADDNCTTATVEQVSSVTFDNDACIGNDIKIKRCWKAFDTYNNVSQICCDTVTIVRNTVIDFPTDITWQCNQYASKPAIVAATPKHPSVVDTELADDDIDVSPTLSNTILSNTGSGIIPNIVGTYCMYQATHSDQILTSCGTSFKIIRTWTVLDWCTGDVITTGVGGEDNVQIIKVIDEKGPVIVRLPFTVGADIPGQHPQPCRSQGLLLPATITDNCNTWTVQIFTPVGEANYVGGNAANGGFIPSPGLELGVHTITYVATDICGNETTLNVQITVVDNQPPTTICQEFTDVNLTSNGSATVFAESFNSGSHDNCCLDHFSVRRMTDPCNDGHNDTQFGPSVVFCCADVSTTNLVTVVFRAFDCSGNTNDCMVQVMVNDKISPTLISAPQNQRVTCDWYAANLEMQLQGLSQNAASLLLDQYFGAPTFLDNCNLNITRTFVSNLDQCLEGTITRTWKATDPSGNPSEIPTQIIFVDHVSDWVVEFPADITVNCGSDVPDFGEPEIFYETCELVAISHEDQIFTIVQDACFKIQRTWVVINWCVVGQDFDQEVAEHPENQLGLPFPQCDLDGDGDCDGRTFRDSWRSGGAANQPDSTVANQTTNPDTDLDSDPWDGYIIYQQVIKINDTVDPIFPDGCDIPQVCILDNTCAATVLLPEPEIQECSEYVTVTPSIKIGNNWLTGFGPFNNVPPGTYQVRYVAEDHCNNQADCETTVTVKDCKKPTPYCVNGLVIELMTTQPPMVQAWANDFNAGSFDNCPGVLKFSFSANVNETGRTYDCSDVGQQVVQMWVTDAAGNQDYCETSIIIQANMNQCGSNGTDPQVAGTTETEDDEGVEGVSLSINSPSGFDATMLTGTNGQFGFSNVPAGGDYSLVPTLDEFPLNGVTTFDLVLISKHILGISALNSPYKLIAADANKSNSVTTFDLVQIRKLILFIDTDFPNNTSWRFVDKDFVFPVPTNPWTTMFPEVVNLNNLSADALASDFIAIKIGDVNGNATVNLAGDTEERTKHGNLVFKAEDRQVKAGERFTVEFEAADFRVSGWQFTLQFDSEALDFEEVAPALADATNFGYTMLGQGSQGDRKGRPYDGAMVGQGMLTASWNAEQPRLVADGETVFALNFRANRNARLSELLQLNSRLTVAEAYGAGDELLGVALDFGGAAAGNAGFELLQNTPNPFRESTVIGFRLSAASAAKLTLSDVNGKVLKVVEGDFSAGYHEVSVKREELPASGAFFYRLECAEGVATKKGILME